MHLQNQKAVNPGQAREESRPFYGWIITGAAFLLILMTAAPVSYGGSVITTRVVAERGWSESVIGTSLSAHYVVMAAVGIPTSFLLKRIGFRRVYRMAFGISLLVYLYLALWNRSPLGYIASFGILGFEALVGAVLCSTGLVNTWYARNRSLPMSLVLSAGGVGGFVYPLITQALCNISVRACWLFFAGLQAVGFLIATFVIKDGPELVGEVPDGRAWTAAHPAVTGEAGEAEAAAAASAGAVASAATSAVDSAAGAAAGPAVREPSLARCYRSPQFFILAFQFFLAKCVPGAVLSYIILFAVQRGVAQDHAVWILTIYSVFGLLGRLSSGVVDRIRIPLGICYAMSFALVAGGLAMMAAAGSAPVFFCGGAVVGGAFGFIYVLQYLLMPRYFGNSNYTAINGTLSTTSFLGNALGSVLVLTIHSLTGDYMYAYLTLAGICALGAILALINRVRLIEAD